MVWSILFEFASLWKRNLCQSHIMSYFKQYKSYVKYHCINRNTCTNLLYFTVSLINRNNMKLNYDNNNVNNYNNDYEMNYFSGLQRPLTIKGTVQYNNTLRISIYVTVPDSEGPTHTVCACRHTVE